MRGSVVSLLIFAAAGSLPAWSQVADDNTRVLYFLGSHSTFQQGCYDPCDCLLPEPVPLRGTFFLNPAGVDPLFSHYDLSRIRWSVPSLSTGIAGAGHYRIGGEVALTHQLTLDVTVGGGPVEHFDSGLVPGGSTFPAIDARVSIHGEVCYDTVLEVHAKPVIFLEMQHAGMAWSPDPEAEAYDVVAGDLGELRRTGGNFTMATDACLANNHVGTTLLFGADPTPGPSQWFLVRGVRSTATNLGTYDLDDPSQAAPRDPGINASALACP